MSRVVKVLASIALVVLALFVPRSRYAIGVDGLSGLRRYRD
jgi:hypothetical protein